MARIVLLLIAGIISGRYIIGEGFMPSFLTILISILIILSILIFKSNPIRKNQYYFSGLSLSIVFFLGVLLTKTHTKNSNAIIKQQSGYFIANIIASPVEKPNSVKVIARIRTLHSESTDVLEFPKAILYLEKDHRCLQYGDNIIFKANLQSPTGPRNPYEFDYKEYLLSRGITLTGYILKENWKIIGYSPDNWFHKVSISLRNKLLNTLISNGIKGDNFSVAAAILLGYDEYMDKDTRLDYMNSGSMHILCVSGLHVGIIYLVFNFLMSLFPNQRKTKIIKTSFLLLIIWGYAAITGFSASVQRAGLMISVFIIGNQINKKSDSYNTLATSAVVLLVINPDLLFEPGFQLSYAAVLGIISFYYPIYNLLRFKNFIVDKIWSITTLSFVAQLGTFPIAIYYFHYFPTWFFVSNLFTFPLSFLILTTGLFFIIISWIPFVSAIAGKILSLLIYLLNKGVSIIEFLPKSTISDIYFSPIMIVAIYALLFILFRITQKPHPRQVIYILVSGLIIMVTSTTFKYNSMLQKRIVFYSVRNAHVFEGITGKHQLVLADSGVVANPEFIEFQFANSRARWGVGRNIMEHNINDTIFIDGFAQLQNFILFNNQICIIVDDSNSVLEISKPMEANLLILRGRKTHKVRHLVSIFNPKKILIDMNVPVWEVRRIIDTCELLGIEYHHIKVDGAYSIDDL